MTNKEQIENLQKMHAEAFDWFKEMDGQPRPAAFVKKFHEIAETVNGAEVRIGARLDFFQETMKEQDKILLAQDKRIKSLERRLKTQGTKLLKARKAIVALIDDVFELRSQTLLEKIFGKKKGAP